ncbi:unnamed protein product [Linum tenue]|uniref:Uncharacterized protein n=1 Tax=Linum tenue TaxID=586396 RepID=A0AAV0RZG9_9ROSI|nr:unnamed protein product [Linum tenue]CAI0626609.1 unnamed protein product [Linum tenue]
MGDRQPRSRRRPPHPRPHPPRRRRRIRSLFFCSSDSAGRGLRSGDDEQVRGQA